MALTRPSIKETLSKAGVPAENMDEAINAIIAGHTATVDALKEKIDTAEAGKGDYDKIKAENESLKQQLSEMKQSADDSAKYKADYEALKTEYDGYKADVETKAAKAESDRAFTAWLKEQGYSEKGAAKIVKYGGFTLEFNKDGSIKNADKLAENVSAEWNEYKEQRTVEGAKTENPPTNIGASMTKQDIINIKDTAERQKKIAENPELFGLPKQ